MTARLSSAPASVLLVLATASVSADVVDAAAGGFTVRTVAEIGAAPTVVYETLVGRVDAWWDPAHTYSGDAGRLSIEARPGGCFCERLEGGGVQHMEIVYAEPGVRLRMEGGLGPLQGEAVTGHLTWELEAIESGTRVTLTYKVVGYIPSGLEAWAAPVDGVLAQAAARLASFVETGEPG